MLDENKWLQYGLPRSIEDVKGITIHELKELDKNLDDYFNYYNSESKSNMAYHYIVKENSFIQLMPDNYMVYHTGKNKDWGDMYTIAIAICPSLSDSTFERSLQNAIDLINDLLEIYSIDKSKIYFHRDFNNHVYDPKRLLDEFETSRNFIYQRF